MAVAVALTLPLVNVNVDADADSEMLLGGCYRGWCGRVGGLACVAGGWIWDDADYGRLNCTFHVPHFSGLIHFWADLGWLPFLLCVVRWVLCVVCCVLYTGGGGVYVCVCVCMCVCVAGVQSSQFTCTASSTLPLAH